MLSPARLFYPCPFRPFLLLIYNLSKSCSYVLSFSRYSWFQHKAACPCNLPMLLGNTAALSVLSRFLLYGSTLTPLKELVYLQTASLAKKTYPPCLFLMEAPVSRYSNFALYKMPVKSYSWVHFHHDTANKSFHNGLPALPLPQKTSWTLIWSIWRTLRNGTTISWAGKWNYLPPWT